jgi:hypothetical protein
MNDAQVRELIAGAVTDGMLGPSSVDVDAVIARERRAMRARRATIGLAAAAVVSAAIVASLIIRAPGGTVSPIGPKPSVETSPSWDEREAQVETLVRESFGTTSTTRMAERERWDGRVRVDGTRTENGVMVAEVFAEAARYQGPSGDVSQCETGPQCTKHPQPDGTVVWLMHQTEAGHTIVIALSVRPDGSLVQVGAVYPPDTQFAYPEGLLIHVATDPRLAAMPAGT